jgi:hypothetical protein
VQTGVEGGERVTSSDDAVAADVRTAIDAAACHDDERLVSTLRRLEHTQDSRAIVLALVTFAGQLRATRTAAYPSCVEAEVRRRSSEDPLPTSFIRFAHSLFLEQDAARLVAAFEGVVADGEVAVGRSLRAAILVAAAVAVDLAADDGRLSASIATSCPESDR